jgi:hypothetical protein
VGQDGEWCALCSSHRLGVQRRYSHDAKVAGGRLGSTGRLVASTGSVSESQVHEEDTDMLHVSAFVIPAHH